MTSRILRLMAFCALLTACAPQQQGAPGSAQPEQTPAATPEGAQAETESAQEAPAETATRAESKTQDASENTGGETAENATADNEDAAPSAQAARPEDVGETESAALPTPPPIDDDPEKLIGLDPAALDGKLGKPELVRHEAPAEIWQYRIDDCVFDVFLYDRKVTYLEARDRAAQAIDTRACLNQLLRARMTAPLG